MIRDYGVAKPMVLGIEGNLLFVARGFSTIDAAHLSSFDILDLNLFRTVSRLWRLGYGQGVYPR